MRRWRLVVLALLAAGPILVLIGLGVYFLWQSGWGFWAWWPLTGSLALAYFLAWRWQKHRHLLTHDDTPPLIWTARDREAWKLVEARAKHAVLVNADQLASLPYFVETAQALALELARFYHPKANDPVSSLTIPEILGVVELAARDLSQMVDQYLPGGHLLSLNDMRRLKQATEWYGTVSNLTWFISSIFSPLNTAVRFVAVQAGMNKPWQLLQENVVVWFFTAYVHRLGSYLIDLNSGRLRVGARRYLELQKAHQEPGAGQTEEESTGEAPTVTLVLAGQVKAGKSSLINALLGEQRAFTDVVPATAEITRYELRPQGVASRFQLLDTVGYGAGGPGVDQRQATGQAARQADLMLLVLHARHPARQADLVFLEGLKDYFDRLSDVHRPAILAVLTHIDLLSPSLEWTPPYDWQNPQRPKEHEIAQAVEVVREQLGPYLVGVVPVCTAPGKIHGVQEWLLPALVQLLDQAHAVAFLRCLKAEANAGKIRKLFYQLLETGKGLTKVLWQQYPPPGKER